MSYQVGLSYQGSLRKIKSFYSCQFLIFTIFPLFQAVRPCSPPAPLSQTLACPVPVPKELWSLMKSGRRVRQSMASCQSSSTRERTSHLMKFYNHFSGEVVSHIFVFLCHICKLTLEFYDTVVLPSNPKCSSSEGRPFRLGTGANMEKVVKMDRDMTKVQKQYYGKKIHIYLFLKLILIIWKECFCRFISKC